MKLSFQLGLPGYRQLLKVKFDSSFHSVEIGRRGCSRSLDRNSLRNDGLCCPLIVESIYSKTYLNDQTFKVQNLDHHTKWINSSHHLGQLVSTNNHRIMGLLSYEKSRNRLDLNTRLNNLLTLAKTALFWNWFILAF